MKELRALTWRRNEYGKQIRKQYERHLIEEKRRNMCDLSIRKDKICNTLSTILKDNYIIEIEKKNYE